MSSGGHVPPGSTQAQNRGAYRCNLCGDTWKNLKGLTYHQKKSLSPCNRTRDNASVTGFTTVNTATTPQGSVSNLNPGGRLPPSGRPTRAARRTRHAGSSSMMLRAPPSADNFNDSKSGQGGGILTPVDPLMITAAPVDTPKTATFNTATPATTSSTASTLVEPTTPAYGKPSEHLNSAQPAVTITGRTAWELWWEFGGEGPEPDQDSPMRVSLEVASEVAQLLFPPSPDDEDF